MRAGSKLKGSFQKGNTVMQPKPYFAFLLKGLNHDENGKKILVL
jgi:hypothetical protein